MVTCTALVITFGKWLILLQKSNINTFGVSFVFRSGDKFVTVLSGLSMEMVLQCAKFHPSGATRFQMLGTMRFHASGATRFQVSGAT
jgi:hypothetical protein